MKIKTLFTALVILFSLGASASKSDVFIDTDTLKKASNYILYNKSENITMVSFSQNKKKEPLVYIRLGYPKPIPGSNAVNGTVYQSNRKYKDDEPVQGLDKVEILKGKYSDMKSDRETPLRNLFTLSGVEFPLHLKLISGKETIELELKEPGQWNIGIDLKVL